jgi:hypothetical protein
MGAVDKMNLDNLPGRGHVLDTSYTGRFPDTTLFVDVEYLPDYVALWNNGQYGTLGVRDYDNPGLDDIDCLNAFENLASIFIDMRCKVSLEPLLKHAATLQGLCIGEGNGLKDCRPFTRLEVWAQNWLPGMKFADTYCHLVCLRLSGGKSKAKDLENLPCANNLEELEFIVPSSIENIHGIKRYPKLKKVSIYSARKLQDISQIVELEDLQVIDLQKCRRLLQGGVNWPLLRGLRKMIYMECSALPDLQFIHSMPKLISLVIIDTNVLDGDLNPIIEHPRLEHFACTSYRHFTHKEAQLMKILRERKQGI